jgi:hypothetical protein
MSDSTLRAGIPLSIPFAIPAYWTAEQALAVVELLDELRERIWQHYDLPLHELIRQERRQSSVTHNSDAGTDDPPF